MALVDEMEKFLAETAAFNETLNEMKELSSAIAERIAEERAADKAKAKATEILLNSEGTSNSLRRLKTAEFKALTEKVYSITPEEKSEFCGLLDDCNEVLAKIRVDQKKCMESARREREIVSEMERTAGKIDLTLLARWKDAAEAEFQKLEERK